MISSAFHIRLFRSSLLRRLAWSARRLLLPLALSFSPAIATTVIPPEFDALVQQADYIVRGTAKTITSEWRDQNGHRNIVTFVEIDVAETIAGNPPSPLVLEMLGGRIGARELIVQGAPRFSVGAEYILFIRGNGVQFTPLVALMHGQYPIKHDAAGRHYIARSDGSPLHDEKAVSAPFAHAAHETAARSARAAADVPAATALTPAEFAARIRASREKSDAARHEN